MFDFILFSVLFPLIFLDGINIARIEELGTWNMQVGLAGSMLLLPNFLGCAVM